VFSKVRLGVSPEINVLATITVTLVASLIVGASLWMARAIELRVTVRTQTLRCRLT
jgi:ABC-type spermidine/putrescine transport system permease subunit II